MRSGDMTSEDSVRSARPETAFALAGLGVLVLAALAWGIVRVFGLRPLESPARFFVISIGIFTILEAVALWHLRSRAERPTLLLGAFSASIGLLAGSLLLLAASALFSLPADYSAVEPDVVWAMWVPLVVSIVTAAAIVRSRLGGGTPKGR